MTSLQELKQQASRLTIDEKRELGNFLLEQAKRDAVAAKALNEKHSRPLTDFTPEQQWLVEHQAEYAGQWVALDGNLLLSHSTDPRQVWEAVRLAREAGVKAPFVTRLESPDDLPFGGW